MIDFNCDLGEGLNNEHLLMPLISSCNIACGGHAGSIEIMDYVIGLAVKHHVNIGAHPSFVDHENFGRVVLDISNEELKESLIGQLELFQARAALQNVLVHHVKPHGALYNLIALNREKANVVVEAIQEVFDHVKLYVTYNSEIEKVAMEQEVQIVYEAFADRNYNDDLTLVPRKESNAILTNPDEIVAHVSRMAKDSKVRTLSGKEKTIKAQTFCIHGDNKNVLNILKKLKQKFN